MKRKLYKKILHVLFCIITCAFFLISCSGNTGDTFQTEVDGHYLWPGYTLEEAVNEADHIVHGRVKEKTGLVERHDLSKAVIVENDLEIEIIRVIKESQSLSKDAESMIYHEIPTPAGEDRSDIPLNIGVGQEVVLFLNPHSRVLGPDYVMLVDDSGLQLATYQLDETSDSQFTRMSLEEFFEMITNN